VEKSARFKTINQLNMSRKSGSVSKTFVQASCSFCKGAHVGFEYIQGKKITKCPTLLSAVCPYCRYKGHTMKNCEARQRDEANIARGQKERDRERKRIEFEEQQIQKLNKSVNNSKSASKFCVLDESSSDDESVTQVAAPVIASKKSYSAIVSEEVKAAKVESPKCVKELTTELPKKKSILERLREPMPTSAPAVKDAEKEANKEAIRLARKEMIAKYKAQGKPIPWAIYDEYNTDDSDSDNDSA
jgi:hypothetical protein